MRVVAAVITEEVVRSSVYALLYLSGSLYDLTVPLTASL
jgi:hypothetical protein